MRQHYCDICNREVEKDEHLWPLREDFQTDIIKEVCLGCKAVVQQFIDKYDRIYQPFLRTHVKQFITEYRERCRKNDPPQI